MFYITSLNPPLSSPRRNHGLTTLSTHRTRRPAPRRNDHRPRRPHLRHLGRKDEPPARCPPHDGHADDPRLVPQRGDAPTLCGKVPRGPYSRRSPRHDRPDRRDIHRRHQRDFALSPVGPALSSGRHPDLCQSPLCHLYGQGTGDGGNGRSARHGPVDRLDVGIFRERGRLARQGRGPARHQGLRGAQLHERLLHPRPTRRLVHPLDFARRDRQGAGPAARRCIPYPQLASARRDDRL